MKKNWNTRYECLFFMIYEDLQRRLKVIPFDIADSYYYSLHPCQDMSGPQQRCGGSDSFWLLSAIYFHPTSNWQKSFRLLDLNPPTFHYDHHAISLRNWASYYYNRSWNRRCESQSGNPIGKVLVKITHNVFTPSTYNCLSEFGITLQICWIITQDLTYH